MTFPSKESKQTILIIIILVSDKIVAEEEGMDDFEVPSFSLGLDLDSEPAPSFSLGLQNDDDPTPPPPPPAAASDPLCSRSASAPIKDLTISEENYCDEEEDDESFCRVFKRLRKVSSQNKSSNRVETQIQGSKSAGHTIETPIDCDDIEDFSTDDDDFTPDNKQTPSISTRLHSGGKLSLSRLKAADNNVSQSQHCASSSVSKNLSNFKVSSVLKSSSSGKRVHVSHDIHQPDNIFSNNDEFDDGALKISGNRGSSGSSLGTHGVELSSKTSCLPKKPSVQFIPSQAPDLATPAFDDFCEEYFETVKKNPAAAVEKDRDLLVTNSGPLAYSYFESDDVRIRKLVRQRLPNFLPIKCLLENQGTEPIYIDYIAQFTSKQSEKSTSGAKDQTSQPYKKKVTSKRPVKEKEPASKSKRTGKWINVKKKASTFTSNQVTETSVEQGQSKPYWFVDGSKKVYVNKFGETLTGRAAYISHLKESGKQFPKKKKKRTRKK